RVLVADARLLRGLRDAVDVRADRDHRLAAAPRRLPRGRNAADAALDAEAVLLEDGGDVLRGLELLEAELAVAEDLIDELLRELRARVDVGDRFFLHRLEPRIRCGDLGGWRLLRRENGCGRGHERDDQCAHVWTSNNDVMSRRYLCSVVR